MSAKKYQQMTQSNPPASLGFGGFLFGIYAWLAFVLCVLSGIVFALLLPGLERRRRWVTGSARATFLLTGMSVKVRGLEKLPEGHCVVVANHASYIDGVLLFGYMPPRFAVVIKGEMQNFPAVHFLLRRIGAKFVERFDASGSARDARHLLRAASSGPVIPVVLSGARHVLPGGHILPRHGHLRIDVLNPIEPDDPAFENSRDLAELSRQRILEVLDEPDLLA